jgi:hypothetical protein
MADRKRTKRIVPPPAIGPWIPVSKELPLFDRRVLLWDGEQVVAGYMWAMTKKGPQWSTRPDDQEWIDVTHWAPA